MAISADRFLPCKMNTLALLGDLNHHLELVSHQVWQLIQAGGVSRLFALPEPRRYPWLQPVLAES